MKDLVVGFFANYNFRKISCWVNSLDRCGFTGDKLVVCGNTDKATVAALRQRDYRVIEVKISAKIKGALNIERRQLLHDAFVDLPGFDDYRYVLVTDMADVIFQTNPSDWLTAHANNYGLIASKESLNYGHGGWNDETIHGNYGEAALRLMRGRAICNAGTIAATPPIIKRLMADIVAVARTGKIEYRDQSAYNVLLHSPDYNADTLLVGEDEGWACQFNHAERMRNDPATRHLVDSGVPDQSGDVIKTEDGKVFAMIHQYNRDKKLRDRMRAIHGDYSEPKQKRRFWFFKRAA